MFERKRSQCWLCFTVKCGMPQGISGPACFSSDSVGSRNLAAVSWFDGTHSLRPSCPGNLLVATSGQGDVLIAVQMFALKLESRLGVPSASLGPNACTAMSDPQPEPPKRGSDELDAETQCHGDCVFAVHPYP